MNLSIPDNLKKWVESRVSDGSYSSSSDYLRDLIRQEQRYQVKLAHLQTEIDAGFASPISDKSAAQISADVRERIAKLDRRNNAA